MNWLYKGTLGYKFPITNKLSSKVTFENDFWIKIRLTK